MTRIRYKSSDQAPHVLQTQPFIAGKYLVQATINLRRGFYVIADEYGRVLRRGHEQSDRALKRAVKEAFKQLGAVIYDEVRTKVQSRSADKKLSDKEV